MRISGNEGDPGYEAHLDTKRNRQRVRVLLNGEEQRFVVTADSGSCWVERYLSQGNDPIMIVGSCAQTERVYGRVEIRLERETNEHNTGEGEL